MNSTEAAGVRTTYAEAPVHLVMRDVMEIKIGSEQAMRLDFVTSPPPCYLETIDDQPVLRGLPLITLGALVNKAATSLHELESKESGLGGLVGRKYAVDFHAQHILTLEALSAATVDNKTVHVNHYLRARRFLHDMFWVCASVYKLCYIAVPQVCPDPAGIVNNITKLFPTGAVSILPHTEIRMKPRDTQRRIDGVVIVYGNNLCELDGAIVAACIDGRTHH